MPYCNFLLKLPEKFTLLSIMGGPIEVALKPLATIWCNGFQRGSQLGPHDAEKRQCLGQLAVRVPIVEIPVCPYTEKTMFPFPFKFNEIWSWWQFSFQFSEPNGIPFGLQNRKETVTTLISHSVCKEMETVFSGYVYAWRKHDFREVIWTVFYVNMFDRKIDANMFLNSCWTNRK